VDIILQSKKKAWLHALRLRTLPLALSSIFAGSFMAAYDYRMRWSILILASLTTIFLQILSNLANDYGDSIHGADSKDRKGPVRAVQSGLISLQEMKKAMILFTILSLSSGLSLLYLALEDIVLFFSFLGLGILAIIAAITYTAGKKPYGYAGLGDISVFLFFGIIGICGTFYLHTLKFFPEILLPAISLGLFSTAVLNINNIRDIESDTKAGKKSIPVRIGLPNAVLYNWSLIIGAFISLTVFVIYFEHYGAALAFISLPLMIKIGLGVGKGKNSEEIDPYLKKMALSTLVWTLLFGAGLLLLN
jgi:1,4-dihydroxy-2-naphthoate polyprenyltransferase